ncbi:MAG: DUF839 domain-containing protein [Gammaproteobacteria bacterium]|nr:DUF839 domain-containing protein [Gammaproteobacteria bacterium]MCP5424029.1 DUF839 domain-containing protein [Gammaproteobacteria bacterium]MCP5459537.1 DUF839 domain-containing protein [Gammaproteobacteria bacterium]
MSRSSKLLLTTALVGVPLLASAGELSFTPAPVPLTDAAKREVVVSPSVTVNGVEHKIGYHVLARSGDKIGDQVFATLIDKSGKPVLSADGQPVISTSADFTSLLPVGDKLYSVTHFESRPGAMYLSELATDTEGNLTPVSTKPIDFSAFDGLWVPCAGSVTPWRTHLGSEEYPPDARAIEEAKSLDDIDDYNKPMASYFDVDPATMTLEQFRAVFNPYAYGYPTEITVTADGNGTAQKHYAMGRVAVELSYVMPDQKTAYISDDGTNVGLFRFVADEPGKLDAGTLYAAKWVQTSDEGAGSAKIEWVDLGHAASAEIRAAIEKKLSFSDLFETAKIAADGKCPEGFRPSNAEARAECLKIKPGMDVVASRFETRRYASMMGATTEFRKMEGISFDPATKTMFLSMSEVEKGMEDKAKDNKYDLGGSNDIRVKANACGAVYKLTLDSNYAATDMTGLVAGIPHEYEKDSKYAGNTCDMDGLANPDNITFIPGYDTLIIGEDTGTGHQNDAIWAYNFPTKKLTRIETTPYGAETTSAYWYPNVNGHGYLMSVVQHPYGESDEDKLQNPGQSRAYVGYIGPFPAMD